MPSYDYSDWEVLQRALRESCEEAEIALERGLTRDQKEMRDLLKDIPKSSSGTSPSNWREQNGEGNRVVGKTPNYDYPGGED